MENLPRGTLDPTEAVTSHPQIGFLHVVVLQKLLPRSFQGDAAILQHIGSAGDLQGIADVLLRPLDKPL